MKKRKVAVFTGNRAEYGLQFPILKAIKEHPSLEYQLLVSGAHLDKSFGNTLEEIQNDGFEIHAEITIDMSGDSNVATATAIGSGILSITQALNKLKPDMLVVYADRFEGFAAVIAASQMNIPTVHIEGGDITEGGALDDSVRHAMTKLSHLHFTTNAQATNRVLAMGEESWRVHTVGLPAIEEIENGFFATEDEVCSKLNLDLEKPVVLFTQHSVTIEFDQASNQVIPSLTVLKKLAQEGYQVIITYPNNDAGGKFIIEEISKLKEEQIPNLQVHSSLGRHLYHGVLALAKNRKNKVVCVGNSSSGMKETPVFGCPTVNIGSRQAGRLRGDNVLDVAYETQAIQNAIKRCALDSSFRKQCFDTNNPYYLGDAGKKIVDVISTAELGQKMIRKGMSLVGESKDGWYR